MSDNLDKLIYLLEEFDLKSTANSLKKELQLLNNHNGNLIVDKIYNHLNQNIKNKNKTKEDLKNSKNIKDNSTNQQTKNEKDKILDNLVEKLCKKVNFYEEESNLKKISNTNIFKHLMNRLDHDTLLINDKKEKENFDKNANFNIPSNLEEDLPRFGGSNKKAIDPNRYDSQGKERVKSVTSKTHSVEEFNHEHSLHSNHNKQIKNPVSIQNPNNTMTKNESQNDDSLFKVETEERGTNKYCPDENLENMLSNNNNLFNLMQNQENIDSSSFFQNSQSMIIQQDDSNINLNMGDLDEYVDDDDPGFDLYECYQEYFKETCKKLSEQYDFPKRAIAKNRIKKVTDKDSNKIKESKPNQEQNSQMKVVKAKEGETSTKGEKLFEVENNTQRKSLLSNEVKFMDSGDNYYPLQYNNIVYDCFNLKVIVDRERTGFEETKEFKIVINSLIAGKYQILEYLGSAAFSKAVKCIDIQTNKLVCLKIIENNKDYVDQSIDEIKLLRYINANGDPDEKNVLKLYDCFYHKEHLFIVTELLKDNLYEFYKYINENNFENYFNLGRLQKITQQILIALEYIHSLKIIHCDLKPENILIKSINNTQIKVIDFGSSCFIHDHLSSYVQSRSYRAPEVILGCKYDYKIDMWSLGCILAELYTGNVIFQNDSIQSLIARIIGIIGPIPEWMYDKGKLCNDFFSKEKLLFMEINESLNNTNENIFSSLSKSKDSGNKNKSKKMHILIPKRTSLKKRLKTNDENFYDFVKNLLEIDPNNRIGAQEALKHPWITESKYE